MKTHETTTRFSRITLFLALALAGACCAQDQSQRFIDTLEKARQTWREGDDLGAQFHRAFMAPSSDVPRDFNALIDRQKAAYESATKLFEQALEIDPKNPQALAEFGRFWAARKDLGFARHYYVSAWMSAYPPKPSKDAPAPEKKEERVFFEPDKCGSRAESELTDAEKADVLRGLGGIAERAGEISDALSLYREALKRYPADPRNRVSLAIALCATGTPDAALTVLQPPAEGAAPAPTMETLYAQHTPVFALACYTLGYIHEQLGLFEPALKHYRHAQELSQLNGAAENDVSENSRMAIARLEDRLEDLDTEEKEWDVKAPERKRRNDERVSFGHAPVESKPERQLLEEARIACEKALSAKKQALADPDFAELLERVRSNQMPAAKLDEVVKDSLPGAAGAKLFQSAEQLMDVAVTKYRRMARLNFELAALKLQLRRYPQARQFLDAAEVYSPNDIAVLGLRGGVLLEMGQWEDAAQAFRKLLSVDNENGAAYFSLGRALAALRSSEGVCSAALDAFSRAVKLGVRDERLYRTTTLVLKDGQRYDGWIKQVDKDYIVLKEGQPPMRVPASEVEILETGPGLRQAVAEALVKYQHGERPPQLERIVGRKHPVADDLQSPGTEGSILFR